MHSFFKNYALKAKNLIIDTFWPPISLASRNRVSLHGTLEFEEWQKLKFIHSPKCEKCGTQLEVYPPIDTICPACLTSPNSFDYARSAIIYDDFSKKLLYSMKYGARKDGVKTYALWLKNLIEDIDNIDLIVPIPIHRLRLLKRSYNQSVWLCHELSKLINKPYSSFILKRIKHTKPQAGLNFQQRQKNQKNAFAVKGNVEDKNIILIDDVYTTGATLNECAKLLKKHGAKSVGVLTLLRVVSPQHIDI